MGVLGLVPFIQKTCPQVIKRLPQRLHSISGKRIVIDGTLITQRLHFAQTPHEYKHVLGWYRIIKELEESGVSALCVFDGAERSVAKAREVERRRDVRRLAMTRGHLEGDRLQRLKKLRTVVHCLESLDNASRQRTTDILQQMNLGIETFCEEISRQSSVTDTDSSPVLHASSSTPSEDQAIAADNETLEAKTSASTDESPSNDESLILPTPIPMQSNLQDQGFPLPATQDLYVDLDTISLAVDDIPPVLASLYLDYKNSTTQLSCLLPVHAPSLTTSTPSLASPDLEDTRVDHVMTKAQHQLTQEEGKLWYNISSRGSVHDLSHGKPLSETPEKFIDNLAEKSSLMNESFQRRTNVPTFQTYQECKEIIQAMGIPCMDTTDTFEAEAFASALVLSGHADYVASEDTDVLVYEAPLVRNLSNRNDPLIIVSGSDVRQSLNLDRDSYVDFALLLGTDFSQRIKNVGPLRAYKFIKEYGSIERIIQSEKKYVPRLPRQAYLEQVTTARKIFRTLPPVSEKVLHLLQDVVKDDTEVSQIMQRYGLGRALMADESWDYEAALDGNYFKDDPSAVAVNMH